MQIDAMFSLFDVIRPYWTESCNGFMLVIPKAFVARRRRPWEPSCSRWFSVSRVFPWFPVIFPCCLVISRDFPWFSRDVPWFPVTSCDIPWHGKSREVTGNHGVPPGGQPRTHGLSLFYDIFVFWLLGPLLCQITMEYQITMERYKIQDNNKKIPWGRGWWRHMIKVLTSAQIWRHIEFYIFFSEY